MSLDDVYLRMLAETINGVPLNSIVGGGDPKAVGEESFDAIGRQVPLTPGMSVLEIGCGCGRVAVPLAKKLGADVRYVGIDIIPGLVSFCRREISSQFPNFEFYAERDDNPAYNQFVTHAGSDLYLDGRESLDDQFDLAVAFSVFTHLQRADAEALLRTIWSRLKDGGMAVVSFLLIDKPTRLQIKRGQTDFFQRLRWLRRPELQDTSGTTNGAVGFDLTAAQEMVVRAGFENFYSLQFGCWRALPGATFQDIVVLKKDLFPADFDPAVYLALNPDVAEAKMNPYTHYRYWGKKQRRKLKA